MATSTWICIGIFFLFMLASSEDMEVLRSKKRVAKLVLEELKKQQKRSKNQ